jgi:hypothetical protein
MFLLNARTNLNRWRFLMADVPSTADEIRNLAQKVAELQQVFNQGEQNLLQAIFADAANRMGGVQPSPPTTAPEAIIAVPATLADLQEQLTNAYTAGDDVQGGILYKITPPGGGVPPPPPPGDGPA